MPVKIVQRGQIGFDFVHIEIRQLLNIKEHPEIGFYTTCERGLLYVPKLGVKTKPLAPI